jgi:hypothetical protein
MKLTFLIACIALSCSGSRPDARPEAASPRDAKPTVAPPSSTSHPVWQVKLARPPDAAGYSFANVTTVAATRAPRPTVVALARFSTSADSNVGTTAPPGQTDGEVLDVEELGNDWLVTTLDDHYELPRGNESSGTKRWYALDHGLLFVDHARGQVAIARFDHGVSTATWMNALVERAAQDARVVAWLSDAAVVAVQHAADTQLVNVHLADGKTRLITSIPGTGIVVAVSEKASAFAAVFNERAECALCPRVEVRALNDGHLEHSFELRVGDDPFPPDAIGGNASVGFDGRQVWFFSFVQPHHSDVTGASTGLKCSYDVFDAATGTRVRTLADATGQWATLSQGCRTHALLPTTNGGALAFAIDDNMHATVAMFPAPP